MQVIFLTAICSYHILERQYCLEIITNQSGINLMHLCNHLFYIFIQLNFRRHFGVVSTHYRRHMPVAQLLTKNISLCARITNMSSSLENVPTESEMAYDPFEFSGREGGLLNDDSALFHSQGKIFSSWDLATSFSMQTSLLEAPSCVVNTAMHTTTLGCTCRAGWAPRQRAAT